MEGFNPVDILIHIINIIVLFLILRTLLYKPVSEFMKKRKDRFENERDEIEKGKQEIEQFNTNKDLLMKDAKSEASAYLNEKKAEANTEAKRIISQAKADGEKLAEKYLDDARVQAKVELDEKKKEVVSSAVDIAKAILEREVSVKDDEQILNTFLSEVKEGN